MMPNESWGVFMERCEELASMAAARGDAPVGSMLVRQGRVVAESMENTVATQDVSAHAEMEVIRMARRKLGTNLSDCVLISNKEPCVMCSYAIRFHKITTVVYKEASPQLGGFSSHLKLLSSTEVPAHWGPPVQGIQINK